ncbi:MAG TPA: histone deacetylase [Anaerolineae bacterium]|nr:histone deacetylase [Anaerolineae bacterium]
MSNYPTLPLRKADYAHYEHVHTSTYLDTLKKMAAGSPVAALPRLSVECTGFEYCLPGYLYGLGGMLEAIDQMRAGNVLRAYCFSLPGHHAYADWGHGYCLLNPMAAAVRYAQAQGFARVLIVDWDIHHGDGTQSIFANDASVYCISIHSGLDMYMATMRVLRAGTTVAGASVGHCNLPLLDEFFEADIVAKMELLGEFYRADESLSAFAAALEQLPWRPDLIFIFSGYDSHKDDCGARITHWDNASYQQLTRYVLAAARQANCPVLSVHGGGYKLPVTISAAVSHVAVLASSAE